MEKSYLSIQLLDYLSKIPKDDPPILPDEDIKIEINNDNQIILYDYSKNNVSDFTRSKIGNVIEDDRSIESYDSKPELSIDLSSSMTLPIFDLVKSETLFFE